MILGIAAPNALGHAAFVGSSPEPGTRLGQSPTEVTLRFTEPLNQALSRVSLSSDATGTRVPATLLKAGRTEIVLRPAQTLDRAPYRVDWHTVSTVDGHALEGSFGFGVRTAATGGEHSVEQSPLARDGWLRIAMRALLYVALLFFAGGVFNSLLLGGGARPAAWLVPDSLRGADDEFDALASRAWSRTIDVGWLAAGAAAGTAVAEAADAGGRLSVQTLSDFLLTNGAGIARVTTVAAIAVAALAAGRSRGVAAGWIGLAFGSIALSGHANSADPRLAAVLTDWLHLLAAAVWIGGIGQIGATWLPVLARRKTSARLAVMRHVLERFGAVALPAFLVVVASGLTNALIQLGHPEALWQTGYGRVLTVKVVLVGLIAFASFLHAMRLRPALLAANPHPRSNSERRHWRLLGVEPWLALGAVAAVAVLVTFPLPPRQFSETNEADASAPCNPCPLPKPAPDQLAVAERAGSRIASFWLRRVGSEVRGSLRLLDANERPVDAPLELPGGDLTSCSTGCWRLKVRDAGPSLTVIATENGKGYRATVPTAWHRRANALAGRLVVRAQNAMRRVRSVREEERLTSGPGTFVRTIYALEEPDRFTYRTSSGAASVVIGRRQWTRVSGSPWRRGVFGGPAPFRTRDFFRWTPYATTARLLSLRRVRGRRVAEVALMDPATPVWFRLRIDLATRRIDSDRMITGAHFMRRRYSAFDAPVEIRPPKSIVPSP